MVDRIKVMKVGLYEQTLCEVVTSLLYVTMSLEWILCLTGTVKQKTYKFTFRRVLIRHGTWKPLKLPKSRDFPGGPVAKTALPMQAAWVRSLGKELDPTCRN